MPRYYFKLIGVLSGAERDILIEYEDSVGDVKEKLKKRYHLAPRLAVRILHEGRTLDDEESWGSAIGSPPKRPITFMAVNPNR